MLPQHLKTVLGYIKYGLNLSLKKVNMFICNIMFESFKRLNEILHTFACYEIIMYTQSIIYV
jgi:hypothetical protein